MFTQPEYAPEFINEDLALVERVLDGDQQAFSDLVTTYQRSVFNLTYRMLGDAREAEDAAQETFLRAYRHLDRYDTSRPFKTWLLSIASHYCIDLIRKRRFSLFSLDELLPAQWLNSLNDGTPEDIVLNGERSEQLQRMLATLNPEERAIIVLRYWNDLSYAEIADMLGTNTNVVKSRLFRARQALANRLRVRNLPGLVPAASR